MAAPTEWLPPFMRDNLRSTGKRTIDPVEWPGGARCCVSIHVHVDGQTVWRALGMEKLVYISNGEYGPRTAVWRILDLLARHGIKASFFIPGWTAENYPHMVHAIAEGGHELGHHSYSHTLADMGLTEDGGWDRAVEEQEFDRALHILQKLSGQEILGYVPPGGELSPHSIEIMLSRGIQYQAQCAADDIPYYWEIDSQPCGLLEVPTHWSIDDAPQFLYTLIPQQGFIKGPEEVFGMWRGDFDAYRRYGRCLVFQVHPQWIGRPGRLLMFERLIEHMKSFNDVWWATGREINDYWRERYPPEATADSPETAARAGAPT
jgi:peptidoglycan/xylan/chitin deacetylase (PgdA/CDA1 family)